MFRALAKLSLALPALLAASVEADSRQLLDRVRSDELSLILLFQTTGDLSEHDDSIRNGFRVQNLRLGLKGELEDGLGYFVQGSFVSSPALLDAAVHLRMDRALRLRAGAFKAPFSAEFLTPAGALDFRQRSQASALLSPGRQVGLQVDGALFGDRDGGGHYALGVFNGNGLRAGNDDEDVLTALRLAYERRRSTGEDALQMGVNVAHSRDADAPLGPTLSGGFFGSGFSGERILAGLDASARGDDWILGFELLGGRFFPAGADRVEASGYHATVGRELDEGWEFLLRWDSLRARGALDDSALIIAGLNVEPRPLARLQLNLLVPVEGDSGARLGATAQLGF